MAARKDSSPRSSFRASVRIAQKLPVQICLYLDSRLSGFQSNSLAGNFRHNWSNLCTRLQSLDSARVKGARASRLASYAENPFSRKRIDDRPSEDPEEVRALKSERPV